jgi:hypothetical protein
LCEKHQEDEGNYKRPLADEAQEALARDLADEIWHFGQTGESEIAFARRFVSQRWVQYQGQIANERG